MKKKFKQVNIYKKCFPGVNSNHLNNYILPTLCEDKPDSVIVHAGVNNIMNGTNHDDLVTQIENVCITCKKYGVKETVL